MHESDRLSMGNGGHDLRRVETPPATHASTCMDFPVVQLIYNPRDERRVMHESHRLRQSEPGSRTPAGGNSARSACIPLYRVSCSSVNI